MSERAWQRLWAKHPWRLAPSGTPASLERITVQGLRRFHRTCFARRTLYTSVAGDVDEEQITDALRRWIPSSKESAVLPESRHMAQPRPGEARLRAGHQQALLALHVITPPPDHPDHYALSLGNAVLGGQSGRLFDVLRERNPLAYSVWATRSTGRYGGVGSYGLATAPEHVVRARRLLRETLAQLAEEGPAVSELHRAKRMMLGSAAVRQQRAIGRAGAKLRAAMYGMPHTPSAVAQRLADIRCEDVQQAMQRVLARDGLWIRVMPT